MPHQGIDVILDEGAFGWEPSLYILAHNPLELVDRMHRIILYFEVNIMKKAVAIVGILIGLVLLPGCITDTIEEKKNDEVENSENYVWEDDGELVIVTYDVTG